MFSHCTLVHVRMRGPRKHPYLRGLSATSRFKWIWGCTAGKAYDQIAAFPGQRAHSGFCIRHRGRRHRPHRRLRRPTASDLVEEGFCVARSRPCRAVDDRFHRRPKITTELRFFFRRYRGDDPHARSFLASSIAAHRTPPAAPMSAKDRRAGIRPGFFRA